MAIDLSASAYDLYASADGSTSANADGSTSANAYDLSANADDATSAHAYANWCGSYAANKHFSISTILFWRHWYCSLSRHWWCRRRRFWNSNVQRPGNYSLWRRRQCPLSIW